MIITLTPKKLSIAAISVLIFMAVLAVEARHYAAYRHWLGYGWHVDLLSERTEYRMPGIEHVQYVKVTNLSLLPGSIELCVIPQDVQPHALPVSLHRVQVLDRATGQWRILRPELSLECTDGQVISKRLWPLMSFYTEPTFVAEAGRKGDWVRLTAYSAFDSHADAQRAFVSPAFQLDEEWEPYPKYSINIRSVSFCVPPQGGKDEPCRKVGRLENGQPPIVDVVCELENTGTEPTTADDFLLLTTMEELVAPATQYALAHLDTLPSTVSWGRDVSISDVKLAVVRWLNNDERRIVRIPGFDLRPLLRQHQDETGLWTWWIRVNVRVESRSGVQLGSSNAMLALIPPQKILDGNMGGPLEDHHHIVRRIRIAPKPKPLW